jgi:hypothetical protein
MPRHRLLQAGIRMTRGALEGSERMVIEGLIALDVHNRDALSALADADAVSTEAFEWQAQLRFAFDCGRLVDWAAAAADGVPGAAARAINPDSKVCNWPPPKSLLNPHQPQAFANPAPLFEPPPVPPHPSPPLLQPGARTRVPAC